jgi:hypothetical protein
LCNFYGGVIEIAFWAKRGLELPGGSRSALRYGQGMGKGKDGEPVDPSLSAARRRAALHMHVLHDPRKTTAKARRVFRESFTAKAAAEGYEGAALAKRAATLVAGFYADMTAESIRVRKLKFRKTRAA